MSTMKKVLTLTLLAVLILGACEKEDSPKTTHRQSPNRVIVVPDGGKIGNN